MKYRVWDTVLNEWYKSDQLVLRPSGEVTDGSMTLKMPVEFSTGLKDDGGEEIFEGDILRWSEYQGWEDGRTFYGIYVVVWDEDKAGFILNDPHNNENWPIDEMEFDSIIGNIHENPKMLPHDESLDGSPQMVELDV